VARPAALETNAMASLGVGWAAMVLVGEQQLEEESWWHRIEAIGGSSVTRGGSSGMVAEERTVPVTVVPGGLGEEKEGRSTEERGRRPVIGGDDGGGASPCGSGSKAARYHVGRAELSTQYSLGFGVQTYRRLGLGFPKHKPIIAH
jgi:hypothetical protein